MQVGGASDTGMGMDPTQEPTDEDLTDLSESIYWKIEHGRSHEAVRLLRQLITDAKVREAATVPGSFDNWMADIAAGRTTPMETALSEAPPMADDLPKTRKAKLTVAATKSGISITLAICDGDIPVQPPVVIYDGKIPSTDVTGALIRGAMLNEVGGCRVSTEDLLTLGIRS